MCPRLLQQKAMPLFISARHLQHAGTCEVQREMHQVA